MTSIRTRILLALLIIAVTAAGVPAMAISSGVRATANQELHFRTGPNTAFTDMYVLPRSTPVVAIELEDGNDVPWVLCEFEYRGSRVRGYTGLKRLNLSGGIRYASHAWLNRRVIQTSPVYAAPDLNATVRNTVSSGTTVTFLGFEGDYCFIEYRVNGKYERGYIHMDGFMSGDEEFVEYFPDCNGDTLYAVRTPAYMYAESREGSKVLFNVPYDACVAVVFDEFYSTPDGWVPIYYGGLHGYGHSRDFNDLRGFAEDY